MLNMNNVAYTEEYQSSRKECLDSFSDAELVEEKTIIISEKYYVKNKKYAHKNTFGYTENILFDTNDKQLYCFTDIEPEAEFFTLIQHSDGNEYLLFRCDLYGYSVLDLSTMKDFHYFPENSLHDEETFIWTRPHYNKSNNIIAVDGCFWACPSDVIIADFTNPMKTVEQINIRDIIFNGFDDIGHIDFAGWDKTDLLLDCNKEDETKERKVIHENEYMSCFSK